MRSALYVWAMEERVQIEEDLKWFGAGSKLYSPSGDDITSMKATRLRQRLRELDIALHEDRRS